MKKMMDHGETYYFLSKPRRFGKTLMVSTLENFFQGKKELFKNTYIHDKYEGVKMYGGFANFGFLYIKKISNFDKPP
jgi:hypothetical protein